MMLTPRTYRGGRGAGEGIDSLGGTQNLSRESMLFFICPLKTGDTTHSFFFIISRAILAIIPHRLFLLAPHPYPSTTFAL